MTITRTMSTGYSVSERQQFVGESTGERNGPLAAVAGQKISSASATALS